MPLYTVQDVWEFLHKQARRTDSRLSELKEMIMALTQNEQTAVNDLSAAVENLSTDLTTVLAAAQDAQAKIQQFMDQDVVDAADKAALQAIIDGMETDVVGALQPLTERLGDMDASLKSPATPTAPLSANP